MEREDVIPMTMVSIKRTDHSTSQVHLAHVRPGPLAALMAATKCHLNILSSKFSAGFEVVAEAANCPTCTKV